MGRNSIATHRKVVVDIISNLSGGPNGPAPHVSTAQLEILGYKNLTQPGCGHLPFLNHQGLSERFDNCGLHHCVMEPISEGLTIRKAQSHHVTISRSPTSHRLSKSRD